MAIIEQCTARARWHRTHLINLLTKWNACGNWCLWDICLGETPHTHTHTHTSDATRAIENANDSKSNIKSSPAKYFVTKNTFSGYCFIFEWVSSYAFYGCVAVSYFAWIIQLSVCWFGLNWIGRKYLFHLNMTSSPSSPIVILCKHWANIQFHWCLWHIPVFNLDAPCRTSAILWRRCIAKTFCHCNSKATLRFDKHKINVVVCSQPSFL